MPQWPAQLTFRNVSHLTAKVNGEHSRFEIAPTTDKTCVDITPNNG
jgi:hypothetical protein